MVKRSMCRGDIIDIFIGSRVMIKPDLDSNNNTGRKALYEHLNTTVYFVVEILQYNIVKVRKVFNTGDKEVFKLSLNYLHQLENN